MGNFGGSYESGTHSAVFLHTEFSPENMRGFIDGIVAEIYFDV
jgi:hypothetical protein